MPGRSFSRGRCFYGRALVGDAQAQLLEEVMLVFTGALGQQDAEGSAGLHEATLLALLQERRT